MPTTYTSALRVAKPATGELSGTWGDVVNDNITAMFEQAIAGYAAVALSDVNTTLTTANGSSDQARNMGLGFTGTLTAVREVVVPTVNKLYVIHNGTTGGFGITVKTAAGTGVTVPSGTRMLLVCDGTNVLDAVSNINGSVVGNVTGNVTGNLTGNVYAPNGTNLLPSQSFSTDTSTGRYLPGSGRLRDVTSGVSRWEIDANGCIAVGPDQLPNSACRMFVAGSAPAQASARAIRDQQTIQSSTTTDYISFGTAPSTTAGAFTLPVLTHFGATQGSIGAGSAVTVQTGFLAGSSLAGAATNYGFRGQLTGTSNYNLYMDGTAPNYLGGALGIGVVPSAWGGVAAAAIDLANGGIYGHSGAVGNVGVLANSYYDGANFRAKQTAAGGFALISNAEFSVQFAPSVAAGAVQSFSTKLAVLPDGRLYGTALHNNAAGVTGFTNQYIASGTYVPTFTFTTNTGSSVGAFANWSRVGNVVTVSFQVGLTIPSAGATVISVTLPIATTSGGSCGSAMSYLNMSRIVNANTVASMNFNCEAPGGPDTWAGTFTYVVN